MICKIWLAENHDKKPDEAKLNAWQVNTVVTGIYTCTGIYSYTSPREGFANILKRNILKMHWKCTKKQIWKPYILYNYGANHNIKSDIV